MQLTPRAGLALLAGAAAIGLVVTAAVVTSNRVNHETALTGESPPSTTIPTKSKTSVILFLGDGMGDSEITIARNYLKGANGRLALDGLPRSGSYTTYSVNRDGSIDYVTDSAASATGWATGRKTYDGAISVGRDGKDLPTILELAQRHGYVTGDVTTAELTDATPAALAAHVAYRTCQGPADMSQCPQDSKQSGGPGSIAEQLVAHKVDLLLGGGTDRFREKVTAGDLKGQTVRTYAEHLGYTVITSAAQLDDLTSRQTVLGLFAPATLPTRWSGPRAAPFTGDTAANTTADGSECKRDNAPSGQPTLEAMTKKSLSLLRDKVADRKAPGFFLQVEGASIDKQDHAANPCAQIGETADFDNAVRAGLGYAKDHPNTLVVVTADHGHTSQIIDYPQIKARHTPGLFQTLRTADGAPMVVQYATVAGSGSQGHTGVQVRIAAQGPQADRVSGITNQTDLFKTLELAMGFG